jgi:copper oxidase (laccase) domain-containing protein
LIAAVGPHISVHAFEVSGDVAEQLAAVAPHAELVRGGFAKPHVGLYRLIHHQLVSAAIPAEQIERVAGCTMLDPERFFSFRRDGRASGRLLSAVAARPRQAGS